MIRLFSSDGFCRLLDPSAIEQENRHLPGRNSVLRARAQGFLREDALMKITEGGRDDPRVQELLIHHFNSARAQTAPESAHALDLSGLKSPNIRFWSAWDGDYVVGIGALKRLSETHGEIKSMHTAQFSRRNGVGSAMLRHIIAAARQMGFSRLSLETGSWPYFAPARELYRRHGFVESPPFGDYAADSNSVFLTLQFDQTIHSA